VANLIATTVDDPLHNLIQTGDRSASRILTRLTQDERLFAVAFCPAQNAIRWPPTLPRRWAARTSTATRGRDAICFRPRAVPFSYRCGSLVSGGEAVLVHDMSFIARRSRETRDYLPLLRRLGLTVAAHHVVIGELSWALVQGLRGLLRGEGLLVYRPVGGRGFAGRRPSCGRS